MSILSLPNELIHLLLINCILVRGVVRGPRLRLVCTRFNECFIPALYDSRILDDVCAPHIGRHWWMRNDRYGSSRLWQQYLVARVLGEADPDVGRFVEIRKAAEALYDRINSQISFEGIVNGLCWLGLERGTNRPGEKRLWIVPETDLWRIHPSTVEDVPEPPLEPPSSTQLNLLCAAAFFDQAAVVESLLEQHDSVCSPTDRCDLFPSPIWIAAFRGNSAIVDIFQKHILSRASFEFSDDQSYFEWAYESIQDAIWGAMVNGNLDLFINVLFPPSLRPYPPAISKPIISGVMFSNQYFSRTPAIYDFITDHFSFSTDTETGRQSRQRNQIAQYARYGNLAMVRHVSGSSAKIRAGTYGRFGNPLYRACRGCFEDIVDFLLDREVDHHDEVLTAATRAGCGGILRKVLKRKITFETDFAPRELLAEIIKREDVPMLQLILEHGYMVTLGRYEEAMEMAVAHGLESMIDCLNELEIVEDPPYFSERYNR